jgi:iron complex outermembrane recepter protein
VLWDASLVWNSPGDRFTIGIHAKNITDKEYITSGYQFLVTDPVTGVPLLDAAGRVRPSLGREGIATAFYGNPRQVFVSLGLNF